MKTYSIDKIKTLLKATIEAETFQVPYDGTNEFYDKNKSEILENFVKNFLSSLICLPVDVPDAQVNVPSEEGVKRGCLESWEAANKMLGGVNPSPFTLGYSAGAHAVLNYIKENN